MEKIKEGYIELHSKSIKFPYEIIDDNESFGLFTIIMEKTPILDKHLHLIFTIDTTLSMLDKNIEKNNDERLKIEYIKRTFKDMMVYLNNLNLNVNITVYTFNTKVELLIDDQYLNNDSLDIINEKISNIECDECTNIELALNNANKILNNYKNIYPNDKCAHIFMTDGIANVGIMSSECLSELVNKDFINIFIGFGKEHNSKMLQKFGEKKNGEYYFIDNLENSSLVYAESIHNIIYSSLNDVKIKIINGELYNYKTNKWTDVLYENNLTSDSIKFYQLKTDNPTNVEIIIYEKDEQIDKFYVLPELMTDDNKVIPIDLTKYMFRLKVQDILFRGKEIVNNDYCDLESTQYIDIFPRIPIDLKPELKQLYRDIKKYMKENNLLEDKLLKLLCEDIYVTYKLQNSRYGNMYISARQSSQGRQRSYNVGNNLNIEENTLEYNILNRCIYQSTYQSQLDDNTVVLEYELDNFTNEENNINCFASPSLNDTFNSFRES
jgi:hypothetical protein